MPPLRGSSAAGGADRGPTPQSLPPSASKIENGAGPAAPLRPDPLPRPTVSTAPLTGRAVSMRVAGTLVAREQRERERLLDCGHRMHQHARVNRHDLFPESRSSAG